VMLSREGGEGLGWGGEGHGRTPIAAVRKPKDTSQQGEGGHGWRSTSPSMADLIKKCESDVSSCFATA